jgi:hypothetical protein
MTAQKTWTAGDVLTAADMNLYARGGQEMGYILATADTTGVTATVTDVTGLTLTFTAISSRVYEMEAFATVGATVTDDYVSLTITDSANTVQKTAITTIAKSGQSQALICKARITGISGSVTYKVRVVRALGTGNVSVLGTGTFASYFTIKDVGAA